MLTRSEEQRMEATLMRELQAQGKAFDSIQCPDSPRLGSQPSPNLGGAPGDSRPARRTPPRLRSSWAPPSGVLGPVWSFGRSGSLGPAPLVLSPILPAQGGRSSLAS